MTPLSVAALSAIAGLATLPAQAQTSPPTETDKVLPTVSVSAPALRQPKASVAGWGDAPAWQQPVQAQTFSDGALRDARATRLADVTRLDASTTDSYNTIGYWDYLSIRGFTLDNAYNYRREGLPINAETRLPLDNKAAVELLKGTSGMQAGVSAPGGLVNLVVKRPEGRVRTASLSLDDAGDLLTSVDLSDRWGAQQEWGLRVNAAAEKLATHVDNTRGHRQLFAFAADRQLAPGHVIEVEYEHSFLRQPSVPGMSLLGSSLPSARDATNLNLNHQPWTLPVEMQGDTGTVRLRNDLGQGWRSTLTYGEQRLISNDRAAFPFGCTTAPDYSDYLADRYCADGRFDLYDFRSEQELRLTRNLLAQIQGQVRTGEIQHQIQASVLRSVHLTDQSTQAYNGVGTGSLSDPYAPIAPNATPGYVVSDRHERTTEWTLQDALTLTQAWQAWFGLRHTQLKRQSTLTDDSASTRIAQDITTPWAALGWTFAPQTRAYLSWGEGVEVKAAPANGYSNPGEVLRALKSRQVEIGVKSQQSVETGAGLLRQQWGANLFHIHRPEAGNVQGAYALDGQSTHQGLEAYWQGRLGAWSAAGSAMVLDAERSGSVNDALNGKRPVNVPRQTLKLSAAYNWAGALPVTVLGELVHEGRRWVDADNTVSLPAWTRVDIGLRATQALSGQTVTWRLGVSNLFDQRAWRESPTSFGHIYLFPLPQRTVTASAQWDF
jgi:iron complex outermembrane receptor protein